MENYKEITIKLPQETVEEYLNATDEEKEAILKNVDYYFKKELILPREDWKTFFELFVFNPKNSSNISAEFLKTKIEEILQFDIDSKKTTGNSSKFKVFNQRDEKEFITFEIDQKDFVTINNIYEIKMEGGRRFLGGKRKAVIKGLSKIFDDIYLLKDTISKEIASNYYDLVNEMENDLRAYVTKFTLKIYGGEDWWLNVSNEQLREKAEKNKQDDFWFNDYFKNYPLYLIDFPEILELLKPSITLDKISPSKQLKALRDKINHISTKEEKCAESLNNLKRVLDSQRTCEKAQKLKKFYNENLDKDNYHDGTKFKSAFSEIFSFRNRIAHNGILEESDLQKFRDNHYKVTETLKNALGELDKLVDEEFYKQLMSLKQDRD